MNNTVDDALFTGLINYAANENEARRFLAAEAACKQAIALKPDHADAIMNLGCVYWNMCRFEESEQLYFRSLELNEQNANTHANLGLLYQDQNLWDKAEYCFKRAIELDPQNVAFQWDRMILELDRGNWIEGLGSYDIRMKYQKEDFVELPYPIWEGQDLTNKSLYIQTEQGIGDRVMTARYLPLIKEHWPSCKIILMTEAACWSLFWPYYMAHIIDAFIPIGVPHPPADYGIYIMNLMRVFETTPNNIPLVDGFLAEHAKLVKKSAKLKLLRKDSLKVGLCWSGNPRFIMNHWREVPFSKIIPLMDDPDLTWFSFQVGERADDIKTYGVDRLIMNLEPKFLKEGWNATLAFLAQMDVLITCDTAIAHLGGTLGIPTWLMLHRSNYWPLGRTEATTTPWYPSMRLIRQQKHFEWDSVISEIKEELNKEKRLLRFPINK